MVVNNHGYKYMKLNLKDITIVGIDTVDAIRIDNILSICCLNIEFEAVKLMTDDKNISKTMLSNPVVCISTLNGLEEYSYFIMNSLTKYIDTDFCLIVQWDGFIKNYKAWTDEFYSYDYIGAPFRIEKIVGNGGFSLRSKKLLDLCSMASFSKYHPEDAIICKEQRAWFERHDIKYAPIDIAYKFAVDGEVYNGQFGFHHKIF